MTQGEDWLRKRPIFAYVRFCNFLANFDMPTVLYINGFRFFFYMNEHEPIHIHVEKGACNARIILIPTIIISNNHGFKKKEIRSILDIIVCNYGNIIQAWHDTFDK